MEKQTNKRDIYIDIIKGIGITSIVIGHASWNLNIAGCIIPIGIFVYLYHLAIFLFCSGYLFNDTIQNYWAFVAKKLKGIYKPFLIYSIVYLLFRNLFINMGILNGEKFSISELLITVTNLITFNSVGEFLSAFWFLPMMFFAVVFWGTICYITQSIKNIHMREIIRIIMCCIVGGIGLYATESHFGLLCNIQISYLMVPIVALGYYFKTFDGKRFLNIGVMVIAMTVMVGVIRSDIGIIELSKYMIINKIAFYPVTICGIYFCLVLAKCFMRIDVVANAFALIGRSSFEIMALHFLMFKCVDYFVCKMSGQLGVLNKFPYSFENLWPVYYVIGILGPIFIRVLIKKVRYP